MRSPHPAGDHLLGGRLANASLSRQDCLVWDGAGIPRRKCLCPDRAGFRVGLRRRNVLLTFWMSGRHSVAEDRMHGTKFRTVTTRDG